jgi:transcriptional regulator with XRE-family HTH domain
VTEDICVRLGKRIRALRKRREWTQTYLSVHSGLGRTYISDVERGKKELCLYSLETVAGAFGMTVSELMKGV